jgi:hypothetical protein
MMWLAQAAQSEPISAPDFAGTYSFLNEGERLQVNVDDGIRVSGFISRFGDLESDRGLLLDHFFSQGSLEGDRVSFKTKTIHGVWFEFSGRAVRGEASSPEEEGYWVLKGTLTRHQTDKEKKTTSRAREVAFKSLPR